MKLINYLKFLVPSVFIALIFFAAFFSISDAETFDKRPCLESDKEIELFVNGTTNQETRTRIERTADLDTETDETPLVVDLQMSLKISEFMRQSINRAGRQGRVENITVRLTGDAIYCDLSIYNTKTEGLSFYSNAWGKFYRDDYFRETTAAEMRREYKRKSKRKTDGFALDAAFWRDMLWSAAVSGDSGTREIIIEIRKTEKAEHASYSIQYFKAPAATKELNRMESADFKLN